MRQLEVWLGNKQVGVIKETRKGGRFEYTQEIAQSMPGVPVLSLSLPAKAKPYGEAKTAAWFEGLLPEGQRRRDVARSLGLSEYDWIGILAEIGWECAGAVRIYKAGEHENAGAVRVYKAGEHENNAYCSVENPAYKDSTYEHLAYENPTYEHLAYENPAYKHPAYERLLPEELALKLANIAGRLPQANSGLFRMSLGGFQEKVCVAMPLLAPGQRYVSASDVYLPVGDAPSTHILKPENIREYPGLAESEAWAMVVASHVAKCSRAAILKLDDAPDTLVVERYDRCFSGSNPIGSGGSNDASSPSSLNSPGGSNDAGASINSCLADNWQQHIVRLHQEDACQALGLPPERKYANVRAPKGDDSTYRKMAALLERYAQNPQAEMLELLRQITVNMAVGNWDAHAKNTSFLFDDGMAPVVAPMYDVLPIADIEPRTSALSLRVDGSLASDSVTAESLVREACTWGVPSGEALRTVGECFNGLNKGLVEAAKAYPKAAERHEEGVRKRIKRMQ